MVLTFANGGTPAGNNPYTGINFTDLTGLLTQLQTTLNTAGWVTVSGTPASGEIFLEGDLGGDKCYVSLDGNSAGINGRLAVRASNDISKTTLTGTSTSSGILIDFTEGKDNIIFVTADTHAFAFIILPFAGPSEIIHFGFCNRIDATDNTCIYIGKAMGAVYSQNFPTMVPIQSTGYSMARVHTHTQRPGTWQTLDSSYGNQGTTEPILATTIRYPIGTTLNPTENLAILGPGSSSAYLTSTNTENTSYWAHIGSSNAINNEPLIGPYYYVEGGLNKDSYGNTIGVNLHPPRAMRGLIPFIVTGMSHLPAGSQLNGSSGAVYITGDLGFQGMRIA